MAFNVGSIVAKLELDKKDWEKSVKGVEKDSKSLNGFILRNDKAIKKIGKSMTIAGGVIVGAFGLMVKSAVGFNKEIANVATLIPGQSERIKELKGNVQDLAIEYGKSTTDITNGLYQVISAFGDTADTAEVLEINVRAAAAGMATTEQAIALTSAVTKAYGDTSVEAVQKVSDLAFQTVKLGQTTFPELAAAIGKVTPLAKELNVSEEELFATFATLTGVTGKASEVTTQFSGILAAMVKPTEGMKLAMASLGKEIGLGADASAKAIIDELGFKEALESLKDQTDGTTIGLGKLFESKEALIGLLPLLSSQTEVYDKKLAAMSDSTGILDEAFKEMSEGINKTGFDMAKLKQMTIVLSQKLGDKLAPMIGKITVSVGKIVAKIIEWTEKHPKLTGTILKVAGAMGALMLVFGPFLMMLPGLIAAGPLIGASFMAMLGPIGLVIAGIAGIAVVINKLSKDAKKNRSEMEAMGSLNGTLGDTLKKVGKEAGLTSKEIGKLTTQYNGNVKHMARRIIAGNEGKKMQAAWNKILAETIEIEEKHRSALAKLNDEYDISAGQMLKLLFQYGSYANVLKAARDGTIGLTSKTEKIETATKAAAKATADAAARQKELTEETKRLAPKIELLTIESTEAEKALKKMQERFPSLTKGVGDFGIALDKAGEDFFRNFKEDSTKFEVIGESMESVIGGIVGAVASGSKQMQEHEAEMEKLNNRIKIDWTSVAEDMSNVWTENFTNIINGTSTFADLLNTSFDTVASGISSSLGKGLTSVLGIVGNLAGPIGGIFTGIISGALGMFKKLLNIRSKAEKEAEKAAAAAAQAERQFAAQVEEAKNVMSAYGEITDATAEKMAELRKTQKGYVAESLVFADVIKDVGANQENLNLLWDGAIKVLSLMNDGQISLVEGSAILDESFSLLVEGAKEFGEEGSDAMVNFILKTREAGIEVASVISYINDQLGVVKSGSMTAAEGLQAMADHIPVKETAALFKEQEKLVTKLKEIAGEIDTFKKLAENTELSEKEQDKLNAKITEATEEYKKLDDQLQQVDWDLEIVAHTAHEMASDLESQAFRVFNAMIANGTSYNEAMESIGGTLDIITQAHKDLGKVGGVAIQELLHIRDVIEENKSLFNAIDGNVAVLTALKNTANLTEDALMDSASQASKFYDEIVNAGLSGDQALAQMAPTLQLLADESDKYGITLDENTEKLIGQAKDMGLVTEAQEEEQEQQERLFDELGDKMAKIMDNLADRIDASLNRGFGDAFDSAKIGASNTRRDIDTEFSGMAFDVGIGYSYDDFEPSISDVKVGVEYDYGKGPIIPTTTPSNGIIGAATGFHGMVRGPQLFQIEPGMEELVNITPRNELESGGRSRSGLGGERDVSLTFNRTYNIPKEVALSPKDLEDMFNRNDNEMTLKIKQTLGRY